MFLNYFKLSLRLLARNPFFAAINIIGLAIGFTSFYILWEYSSEGLQSDQYHPDADRIVRVDTKWEWLEERTNTWGVVQFGASKSGLVPILKEGYPEVESSLRLRPSNRMLAKVIDADGQQRIFAEDNIVYADTNLFTFFKIPLVYGDPRKVMRGANQLVLSTSAAIRYFGDDDPTGKMITVNDTINLRVSGVFEDLPHNTILNFEMVISNDGFQSKWDEDTPYWNGTGNYLKLTDTSAKEFESKINKRAKEYWPIPTSRPNRKLSMPVEPLTDIIFGNMANRKGKSKILLTTFSIIAVSILAMAWVNYINLSITRTKRRFKEIATRKVSGAGSKNILAQFIIEAFVTNGLALAISITLIQIVRVPVDVLFEMQFKSPAMLDLNAALLFLLIILPGIVISGIYPALITFSQKPSALFNNLGSTSRKRLVPSILTVAQLAVAIVFILSSFIVSLQLSHILNMDLGIDTNQVVVIAGPTVKSTQYTTTVETFKDRLSSIPGASTASLSTFVIQAINGAGFNAKRLGSTESFGMDVNGVDEDFVPLYDLQLIAGRNFMKDDQPDRIMLSRFATVRLGYASPEDAVGDRVETTVNTGQDLKQAEVIGIFEDFHNMSFLNVKSVLSESETGRGIVYIYKDKLHEGALTPDVISVRISEGNVKETMAAIEKNYKEFFPNAVFDWSFVDDTIQHSYTKEKISRNQIILFASLALLIACLGMLGIISYEAAEKTKEIGIRKVLGAQLHQIVQILVGTTFRQILAATMVGIPVAYYLTQEYLEKFSERIPLQWWHFALPILILTVIMFSTIASVLWKAARNNPVEALKYE